MHIARELRRLNRFSFLARNQNFTNGELFEKMEHVTKLKRDSALKNLYQKTQASLVLGLLSKLPKSDRHPLNTLKEQYFLKQKNSELGLQMFVLSLLAQAEKSDDSSLELNRIKLAQLVELLHIAFEIHDCILEPNINDSEAERKEIEDANRLAVIAGDFFMAAASTQLAELENQQIVDQISKSIGDTATGRVLLDEPMESFQDWLVAANLNHTSLIKRGAWSTLFLSQQSSLNWENVPFLDKSMNQQFDVEIMDDLPVAGAIFATYLYLAKQIKWDWQVFLQGNTSQFLLPICLQKENTTSDVHDLVRDLSNRSIKTASDALTVFPQSNSRNLLKQLLDLQKL